MLKRELPVRRAAAALLAGFVLAGCTASKRYQSSRDRAFERGAPAQVETATTVAGPPAGRSGDAQTAGLEGPELTLEALRVVALDRNPTLAAMRASWQAAVERYPQVRALADPQLGYAIAPATIASESGSFGQRIELSQHLPWPGKLELRGEAALSTAEATGEDFEDARQRLVRAVAEAFYAYQLVHRAIEINRTNQGLLAELQRVAERRYAAGLASKSDALQAEIEHQHLVHRGVVLERERAVAQARINTLLDLPPKSPLPPPPRRIPRPTPLPPLPALEKLALEGRPRLEALRHAVSARSSEVELAHREYYPDLSINAGYNSLWEESEKRTLVGLAINLPLQLGRRRAALSQARAEQHRAEARLEEARANTLLEVSEAYDELVETRHVVHLYGTSIVAAAEENLETARTGYEAGTNDFLTLVSAEKALYLAELTYEQALAQFQQRRARLEYAVGESLAELEEKR